MLRKIKKVNTIFIIFTLMIFTGCKCAGFDVEKGIVHLPLDESILPSSDYDKEYIEFPQNIYKKYEKKLIMIQAVYNRFSDITENELNEISQFRDDAGSLYYISWIWNENDTNIQILKNGLSNIGLNDKTIKKIINFGLKKKDKNELNTCYGISLFSNQLKKSLFYIKDILNECALFENKKSFTYQSKEDLFNKYMNIDSYRESILFIEKYFPEINFVKEYKDTLNGINCDTKEKSNCKMK